MELPNIGQQCSEISCKQLDFLPLTCKCGKLFCSEHFAKHSPDCSAIHTQDVQIPVNTEADYICSYPSCRNKSYVPLICEKCNKHFCVEHRHIVDCNEKTIEQITAELEKFTAPVKQFNEAKLQIDKQVSKNT